MRRLACVLALVVITAGCVDQGGSRAPDLAFAPAASSTGGLALSARELPAARTAPGIASLPDKGALLEYGQPGTVRREGAYTWHPAEVSEEHALQAVMTGKLRLTAPSGRPLDFTYEKPEEFLRFKCDVHPWMFSYVSVLNHPFHAVTDADGKFEIKGLPDGKYKVKFKHRKAGEKIQEVEIKDGKANVDIVLKAPTA